MLMTVFLKIFQRFPATFRRFPKILLNLSESRTNAAKHLGKVLKISKDVWRFPKIAEDFKKDPKMFRLYPNGFKMLLWWNSWYPFFYIFVHVHNRSFLDILPNFNPLQKLYKPKFLIFFMQIAVLIVITISTPSFDRIVDAKLGRLLCLLMGIGFYTAGFLKVIMLQY